MFFASLLIFTSSVFSTQIIPSPYKPDQPRENFLIDPPGNSQQTFPMYIGNDEKIVLPKYLKKQSEDQFLVLFQKMRGGYSDLWKELEKTFKDKKDLSIEFLSWPAYDIDSGQYNWVFVGWKIFSSREDLVATLDEPQAKYFRNWIWLSDDLLDQPWIKKKTRQKKKLSDVSPLLPSVKKPFQKKADYEILFSDFLEFDNLYQQPYFSECVWFQNIDSKEQIFAAWHDALDWHDRSKLAKQTKIFLAHDRFARCFPQPPRWKNNPIAIIFDGSWDNVPVEWVENQPSSEKFHAPVNDLIVPLSDYDKKIKNKSYKQRYEKDIWDLSGVKGVEHRGEDVQFVNKGSFQPNNDLIKMVEYLEDRYRSLGITPRRQNFMWRDIPQANLIVVLKSKNKKSDSIVVLADHIDGAVQEDKFEIRLHEAGGKNFIHRATTTQQDLIDLRPISPSANDNLTATSTLLRAAEVIGDNHDLDRDIWLVHLTGEEFPSDGLGAWHFLSRAIEEKLKIEAFICPDFIGRNTEDKNIFHINPTWDPRSIKIAEYAMDASRKMKKIFETVPAPRAIFQPRQSPLNGVFNTDVMEVEFHGLPGLLFNENLNYQSDALREQDPHNHQSSDTPDNVKMGFASDVSKIVIETTARVAKWGL